MISYSQFPNCCGLGLLHGERNYKTAETYFKDFASLSKNFSAIYQVGAVMFEHNASYDIGVKIKEYVEKHGLGTVHISDPIPNPVHGGREFLVYTWKHDRNNLRKHCAALLKPPEPLPIPVVPPNPMIPPPIETKPPRKKKAGAV